MADSEIKSIVNSEHPTYSTSKDKWSKYRLTMDGGDNYIDTYLIPFSDREDATAFSNRKSITPLPGFATAALIDIKNAIFQRLDGVRRTDGSSNYRDVMNGLYDGVDLQQSTMNHFIGREVLPDLIFMGKVGIYIDMPVLLGNETLTDVGNTHPYIYVYRAEQIKNWVFTESKIGYEFDLLLLEETYTDTDEFNLPNDEYTRYRLLRKVEGGIEVSFYDADGGQINSNGEVTTDFEIIEISKIPFVLLELEKSLLTDIANHQIALMNMESADVNYSLAANFPFYVEQTSGKFGSTHLKGNEDDEETDGAAVDVGPVQGRRYTKGLERPGFINPSAEPLKVSMEKQRNLKDDIRALANLALSAVRPKFSSAESKQYDERGLESGLALLGLVLEQAERQIAKFYAMYESSNNIATVWYPERYDLQTTKERISEAAAYAEQMTTVPSRTYQDAIAKEIASILLGAKVSQEDLNKIMEEIDAAEWLSSDAKVIIADIEAGLLSKDTGSKARGYGDGEVAKAKVEHAERIAMIQTAQSNGEASARGVDDLSFDDQGAKAEKELSQSSDLSSNNKKQVRGEAK